MPLKHPLKEPFMGDMGSGRELSRAILEDWWIRRHSSERRGLSGIVGFPFLAAAPFSFLFSVLPFDNDAH